MHGKTRIEPNQIFVEAQSSDEDEEDAKLNGPDESLPKNKLITKLAHGLQAFV